MQQKEKLPKTEKEANDIFSEYIVQIEKVIDYVDKIKKPTV